VEASSEGHALGAEREASSGSKLQDRSRFRAESHPEKLEGVIGLIGQRRVASRRKVMARFRYCSYRPEVCMTTAPLAEALKTLYPLAVPLPSSTQAP
jgi:hypothetical protein